MIPIDLRDVLHPILTSLDLTAPVDPVTLENYQVERIFGGSNNLLYRLRGEAGDFAVKFTLDDGRDRAGREFNALTVLDTLGLDLAARPILLDRDSYARPVMVQTWLTGEICNHPPETDDDWLTLLRYLYTIHQITPEQSPLPLQPVVLFATLPEECRRIVQEQVNRIPDDALSSSLRKILWEFEAYRLPDWEAPPLRLVRSDTNNSNFVWYPSDNDDRSTQVKSVDWEYSGWGDPAFEMIDMITHPAYMTLSHERRAWILQSYCAMVSDAAVQDQMQVRMMAYYRVMAVWWVVRMARYLYEVPRGLDPRLMERNDDWQQAAEYRYDYYLQLAANVLNSED